MRLAVLSHRSLLALLGLVLLAGLASGCAHKGDPSRLVRLVVLDGTVEFEVESDGEQLDEGWWFSARDRYLSPNPGVMLGEALTTEFGRIPGVEVYSREDLRVYMAQKERLLKRAYPDLRAVEVKNLLLRQDPLDYGRSLNMDYVLRSDVEKAATVTNRTFSWWYSTLHVNIELWDVSRGQLVQRWTWKDTDSFDSQLALAEECAREIARKARRRDVFLLYP